MSDVGVGDAVRNNSVILDQRFTGHWSRKSIHFTAEIICKVYSIFIPDFVETWVSPWNAGTQNPWGCSIIRQNKGFFFFLPHLVELQIVRGNCKKKNLRFKSTTILEGSCTVLERVKNEQAVLLKADFRKPHSCLVVRKLFVAVALVGHVELSSRAENSKPCQSYETHPCKDGEQCHIQQALLCSQLREKCP